VAKFFGFKIFDEEENEFLLELDILLSAQHIQEG
jgi:hypothetical protein